MAEALYQPFPLPGRARGHIWKHRPETRRPRHFHAEPELNLIAAGWAKFGMAEAEIEVTPGDLLWWPPGQDHVLLDASSEFDLFVIGLTPELSRRVLDAETTSSYEAPTRVRLADTALCDFRTRCLALPDIGDSSAVERHVGDLWRSAHSVRSAVPDRHSVARRALVSLLERPELTRADVALAVREHPTEVSRYFHKDMGLTLCSYRTRLRLLRFIGAVDGGAANLLSAALDAGFGSYSQCHRVFVNVLGHSPREFFATDVRARMSEAFASARHGQ